MRTYSTHTQGSLTFTTVAGETKMFHICCGFENSYLQKSSKTILYSQNSTLYIADTMMKFLIGLLIVQLFLQPSKLKNQ
jgi:hypothetical protein